MSRSIDALYDLAEARAGYFTTRQAHRVDVSRQQLSHLARTGSVERVAHGIYRLRRYPAQRFEDVVVACLWAGDDAAASHETALAVHGLTDAMPAQIHVTTPRRFRGERPGVIVHTAPLSDEDRVSREGVPVTNVARTIADVTERSGPRMATQAAAEAIDRGLVTRRQVRQALAAGGHDRQAILLLILNEEGL